MAQRNMRGVPLPIRFWSKVDLTDSDKCWNWTAATDNDGYGQIKSDGKMVKAHRLSWALFNEEPLPDKELHVIHSCDNPSCVNPAHLSLGTPRENVLDAVSKGRHGQMRQRKPFCLNGHPRTPENLNYADNCMTCARERSRARRERIREEALCCAWGADLSRMQRQSV